MDETDQNPTARSASGPATTAAAGSYKGLAIALAIVVIMLCVGLWARHNNATKQAQEFEAKLNQLSNQVVQATADLNESRQVNTSLESNLAQEAESAKRLSNTLTQTSATLARTEAEAKKAAQAAAEEMAKRDQRITELEGQRDELTKRMTLLNGEIVEREAQIAETERKLATSEGDRAFLLKELRRLQQEKMDLERQFNDLAMLRDQVRKLKDELSISKRLDWIRRGIYGTPKGAEKLAKPLTSGTNKFDLNVELRQDGSVKVNPGATNAPPK